MTTTNTKAPTIRVTEDAPHQFTITFNDGSTDFDEFKVNAADLSDDIRQKAMMHGLKQKLIDAAAISRNPETGKSASAQDKRDAVWEVLQRISGEAGEWNKRREGGETGGLLLRALLRMYDGRKTREELVEFLASKSDKEKAALRANEKVAKVIAAIRAEGADDSIDTDAMLAGL